MSADVTTSGEVRTVEIYLAAAAAGTSGPVTLTLAQTAPGMWTATGAAPATPGEYHYSVGLFGPSGRYPVVANDAWVVQVTGPGTGADGTSGSTSAQPIPPNLLLAPPFSYGNPVAADFTANGRSIHGSEVVSTARPDVPASTVAQFYLTRLPRAGWTITQSQLPGASGRSFTIAAAAGTQVCFIDFSAATVHVFYGTAGQ